MTAAANHHGRRTTTRTRRLERAGIRDVAAAAGVSITTVSDALNGKGRLPDETRTKVREVAERLGYRPSAAARTLRTGRSGLIGLTVTTYGQEPFTFTEFAYFAEMARAATSAALNRGYALVVLPASSRHDVWSNVALDGTVVIDPSDHDPMVADLYRQGLPVVSDGKPGNCPVTAWVDNDHHAAVLGILDHLAQAGARRIGLLTGTSTDTYTRLSTEAYLGWCGSVGQEPLYEAYPAHDPCAGAVAADRLLARPDRPDAVYGLFDPNGTDLLAAARRYNLRVPDDLLLVCCSESDVYATTEPPITTLSLKPRRIGTTVVNLLIDAIEGQTSLSQTSTGQTATAHTSTGQTSTGQTSTGQTSTGRTSVDHSPAEQKAADEKAADENVSGQLMPTELIVRRSSQRRSPRTTVSAPRPPGEA